MPRRKQLVELTPKTVALIVVLAAVMSSLVSYTVATLANPPAAGAGPKAAAASEAQILSQLRLLNKKVGTFDKNYSLAGISYQMHKDLVYMCRAVAEQSTKCPSGD